MKEWNAPVIDELNIEETQYGGTAITTLDNVFIDEDGVPAGTMAKS